MDRKKYHKPKIKTEKLFENTVLACGKCPGGSGSPSQCGTARHS